MNIITLFCEIDDFFLAYEKWHFKQESINMQLKHLCQSEIAKKIAIWAISTGLLFFGFYTNLWHVAEQQWFANHQKDTEAHIMGRMVKSRQDGIFSAGGLNGWGTAKSTDAEWIPSTELGPQYTAYLYKLSFEKFSTYNSQPGGQGMIFSLLDRRIPFSPQTKLNLFYVRTYAIVAIARPVRWELSQKYTRSSDTNYKVCATNEQTA